MNRLRARLCLLLAVCLLYPLAPHAAGEGVTDGNGLMVQVPSHARAVVLLGSYADAWVSAGGILAGATDDHAGGNVPSVGAAHHPSLEGILALDPEVVVLSSLHSSHLAVGETLEKMGIPCLYYQVTRYEHYLQMMQGFSLINNTAEAFEQRRAAIADGISAIIAGARQDERFLNTTCLLVRMYATGVRSKATGTIAGEIFSDMGLVNIVQDENAPDLLSMEAIIQADPDYVFLVAMGAQEEAAHEAAQRALFDHPAWAGLSAVRNDRVFVLEKRLFHNKPNDAWPEAYAWVAATVYGQR